MQKTFLKFMVFELVERIARFRLLLNECANQLHESAPVLHQSLTEQARLLEDQFLSQKSVLNGLFSESGSGKPSALGCEALIETTYTRLSALSQIACRLKELTVVSETHLFLKDVLPLDLLKQAGEHSVFLRAEGCALSGLPGLPNVLIDSLSVLQKNNPLAWVSLSKAYSGFLLESASSLESLKLDLVKGHKKLAAGALDESTADALIQHAINLRLLGPAYYFQALSEAFLTQDAAFLRVIEPALFFGLNHQNFTHKNLVILHEACERSKPENGSPLEPLTEDTLAVVFRAVEKMIPAKYAFSEKNMQRAIQLQDRLSQGILLSSTALYPLAEVAENLAKNREKADFSIYEPLAMLTEYPHSPKEIVNAGWLHKMERGPVWLYAILNESRSEGFENVMELLNYQDQLLRKSIETSEIHRVLVCGQ